MTTTTTSGDISAQLAELRAEMRSENGNTRRTLDKVATAVDRLSAIEAKNQDRDAKIADHETRLRSVERSWLKTAGALGFISIAGPFAAKAAGFL